MNYEDIISYIEYHQALKKCIKRIVSKNIEITYSTHKKNENSI